MDYVTYFNVQKKKLPAAVAELVESEYRFDSVKFNIYLRYRRDDALLQKLNEFHRLAIQVDMPEILEFLIYSYV